MKRTPIVVSLGVALLFSVFASSARAGTNTDNFNTSFNYLTNGVAGTIWEGLYLGPGGFPNATGIGTAAGSVSVANANITSTSNLTVSSLQTDWENAADDGFFLFKIVTGDFDMSVHLVPPIDNGTFNYFGLMARAFGPAGAPIQPTNGAVTENYLMLGRFDEFGFANMLTPNLNGGETDTAVGAAPNTNYWLRIQRTNNDFNLYESPTNGGWTLVATRTRTDFNGVPLQVGLAQADYGGGATRTAKFEKFSLSGPNVNPSAPPSAATGLTISTNSLTNSVAISWTPGAGSAGSVVIMRTSNPTSRAPSYGITNSGNAFFGSGQDLGGSNFVVFAGSGSSVTVTNLAGGVRYYVAVYSYSGSGSSINYNLSSPATGSQVAPGPLQLLSITLNVNPQIPIGGLGQCQVTGNYLGGSTNDVTSASSYSSSNTNIIAMTSGGGFQGLAYGSATITATYQSMTNSKVVTVMNPILNSLTHRYSFTSDASDSIAGANGVLLQGSSISNGTVRMDGTGGFVDLPDNLVAGYTAVTFEAWVRDDGSSPGARIYDLGNNTNNYVYLALPSGSGDLRGGYKAGGGSEQVVAWTGNRPPAGQMTHIVWTSDAATDLGVLYVNGVQVGITSNFITSPSTIGTMTNNMLGRSQFPTDPAFKGAIDEFRTYNVALSAANVLTNFQNGPNVLGSGITGLTGVTHRWTFSEGSGTNIADSAGSANGSVIVIGAGADFSWVNGAVRLIGGARTNADYIQFPSGLIHSLTNVTVEAWVTPLSGQAWSRLFDFGANADVQANNYYLSLGRGGTSLAQQRYEFGAPAMWTVDTALATTAGQQYHYVATWSATGGANGGGQARWYRDGVLAATANTASSTVSNVDDTVLWLGRSHYPGDNSANADFNELRIYNKALSPDEINFSRINGPNSLVVIPPQANDDFITLNPAGTVLLDVLQNDTGNPLNTASVIVTGGPGSGSAIVKPGGKILYTHSGSPGSSDSFAYTVKDAAGTTSNPGTVHVTISSALRLPNTTVTVPNTPPPVSYQVVDAFPGLTITQPLALRSLPGSVNTNLLFIVERRGFISYLDLSQPNPTRQMFMNISNQLVFDNSAVDGELGFLSLDFHPNFWSNGMFFVSYTAPGGNPYHERVSRFVADAGIRAALQANTTLPNLVDTNSQQILFDMTKREFNHNGADLHFGNDGYLYISMGDEGGQYNVRTNAQRLDLALWSGILRIDVDKNPTNLEPNSPSTGNTVVLTIPLDGSGHAFYSVPVDNPFLGFTTNADGIAIDTNHLRGEFYAIGLRHPWRFSVDKPTGDVWVGVVGQDSYEAVYKLKKGGNYGWPYYEANHLSVPLYGTATHPGLRNPPPGFVLANPPLFEYPHNSVAGADPSFAGLDVNGSLLYRGASIPELTNAYLFGDFDTGGNVWALRTNNNVVTVERLTGMPGISAFGTDPRNGDLIMCNYLQNKLQKLVKNDVAGSTFPSKLSDTGIFADLGTLAPNPGIVSYSPNVAFWSDYAIKTRWFTIPDLVSTVNFTTNGGWGLPTGMKWIKHFDLELNRGNPATKKRIETRVLVKTAGGVYGVSYKWNDTQDEAFLVGDSGDLFQLTVTNNGVPFQQDWEIPSRSSCLACHTPVAGFSLTFNTREMNKDNPMNGVNGNQIQTMSSGGYFSAAVPNPHTLPAFAVATDTNFSLEYRVRSYLAVNCIQCHQPGGAGQGNWDARPELTLAQTQMINGTPVANDGGNPANKIIVPGDTNHSVLLLRLENTNGFSRMPPLATHQLDLGSIALVQNWITGELPGHVSYSQWITNYPSLIGPAADPGADPDGDGANNYFEFLTGTSPLNGTDAWKPTIQVVGGTVQVSYPQVPNLGVVIDVSTDLATWTPWDVAGNQPVFASFGGTRTVNGPVSTVPPFQFFRARLIQP